MGFETIDFSEDDAIATLILNRPQVLNALNSQMRAEITVALSSLSPETRCVVLTGAGRAFCSGQDLADAHSVTDLKDTLRREYEPMLHAVLDCPVPIIAAVNGIAAGAGANLALATDIVIAAESAAFIQAFSRIGLIPDVGGTWMIPRRVGLARAMGMMLFAEPIPARQAADWGLIWQALPDALFADAVAARARYLSQGPTLAYRGIRAALRASSDNDLDTQLALEARLQQQAGHSADFTEGVSAFLEKRPPRFQGR